MLCLSILEAIKNTNKKIKFYQAGTSEMFGKTANKSQNENTILILKVPMEQLKFLPIR